MTGMLRLAAAGLALAALSSFGFAQEKPKEYVGREVCQGCHEDISHVFEKSAHQSTARACESCHGPGSGHAESADAAEIRNPAKLKSGEASRVCLACHQNLPAHTGRIQSSHARNHVSCVDCHSVHRNNGSELVRRTRTDVNAQCATCHTDVWASFQRPYKHRLPEGAMSCVDCHNPHGTVLQRSIRTANANEPTCFGCHADKRGPFAFEHAPVRLEGCPACHEPHGSANPRMLTRHEVRFVCLECHSNLPGPTPSVNGALGTTPPAFHDLRSPRFQNCNVCHQKVHGSYVDRGLLK
jgi:DmsE family decaheme c-type cytochrome